MGTKPNSPQMSLESAINELTALHASIAQQINQLANLVTSDESARAKLASRIHNEFRIADLTCEAADRLLRIYDESGAADGGRTKAEFAVQLHEVEEDLKLDRSLFRKAQLTSRKTTVKTQREERDLLFARSKSPELVSSANTAQLATSRTLRTAEDATASLRRSHQLLEMEIAKSAYSLDVLDESNVKLKKLTERYSAFDIVLGTSRRAISVLEQADKWDRIYMLCSLGFLLLVVLWILWRRILRGPVRLVIWTTVKGAGIVGWATGLGKSKEAHDHQEQGLTQVASDVVELITTTLESLVSATPTIELLKTNISVDAIETEISLDSQSFPNHDEL